MHFIAVAILLGFSVLTAHGEMPLLYSASAKFDGKYLEFKVSRADVVKAPVWPAQTENPPLSPRKAEQIARDQLQKFVRDTAEWDLHEIELIDTGDHLHWIYTVNFLRRYRDDTGVTGGDYFNIPVLMDGTAVAPEVRPSSL